MTRAPLASTEAANADSSLGSVPTRERHEPLGPQVRHPLADLERELALVGLADQLRADQQRRHEALALGAEADRVGDAQAIALLLQPDHGRRIDREHAGDVLDDRG